MPRRVILDAHEWVKEVPFFPRPLVCETTARGTGHERSAGQEVPVELDSIAWLFCDLCGVE